MGLVERLDFYMGFSICLYNAIMSMYGRFGWRIDAIKVFEEIPEPDVLCLGQRGLELLMMVWKLSRCSSFAFLETQK